uniref:DNA sulfur modification protein DndB n=1 Tax=Candidatus Kentrum sp. DK TaxID=2126562 RepID=A0A450T3Y7_9GAMM|nr:MAG: DNA sulfur modification protein DndB [Candidatus Kentron sp. DK]
MSTNYVPAIKAKMGDWTYYITKMKFGEVEKQVELAEKIHPNRELDALIQRELSSRVGEMTDFLLKEPQRFYGSLVVAIYKGNPRFHPIRINEKNDIVDEVNHAFGLLEMDGSQTYFALDGQHRLESIKNACKENPDLREDDISVLVIKHDDSKVGMIRTRRLFTKLNRYAKPTNYKMNIAIDEDDCVAISTRRLVRELDTLKEFVKIDAAGKQMSSGKKDSKYFTTMATLYECNIELAKAFLGGTEIDKKFLSSRPSDEYLDDIYDYLEDIWKLLMSEVGVLRRISWDNEPPGTFRTPEGGSIWVRPIFQLIACEYIKRALLAGHERDSIIKRMSEFPQDLNEEPWVNILWSPGTKRITGAKSERAFCVDALVLSTGMGKATMTKKELREKYGQYYNQASKEFPNL